MAASVPKHLKIGFVLDDGLDNPDGVQQYILALGTWLHTKGHEVRYLVGETKRNDIPGVHSMSRNMGVRFNGNKLSMPLPTSRRRLRRFMEREKFDVLHVQVPYSPFMGHQLIMAARPSVAVIGTFHIAPNNPIVSVGNRLLGLWLHYSLKRFDTMLSVSTTAADFATQTFRISSQVLPNVIDYARFHEAKALHNYGDDRLTILFLGRLVPRKGCQQLLAAVQRLYNKQNTPKFRVVICGSGPLETHLKKYVAHHGLQDIVEFVGFISEEDKPRYLASADISVFPSSGGESFGIVLLEAMASGHAAVLAGDNAGYRSVLIDRPDLLFDPHDTEALAAKLENYLADAALRYETAAWGASFTKDFDTQAVGQNLVDIYQRALHKRRNP